MADANTIERRAFEAKHAGDIWYGDVMHGPHIQTPNGQHKVYLVSLMDDASRLIAHSAFCHAETALEIEGVLKQAVAWITQKTNRRQWRCISLFFATRNLC